MFGLDSIVKSVSNLAKNPLDLGNLAETALKAATTFAELTPQGMLLKAATQLLGDKAGLLDGLVSKGSILNTFASAGDSPLKGTGVEGLVSQIGTLSDKIDSIKKKLADPNLSEKDRQQLQFELQTLMQERMMMITTATNTLKQDHDARMAVANNLR